MEGGSLLRRIGKVAVLCLAFVSFSIKAEETFLEKLLHGFQSNGQKALDPAQILNEAATYEAKALFQQICSGQARYFNEDQVSPDGRAQAQRFTSAGPTPIDIPKGTAVVANWDDVGWRSLGIWNGKPIRFRYTVKAEGEGEQAKFVATAEGDLNGNGHIVTLEVTGKNHVAAGPLCGAISVRGNEGGGP